MLPDHGLVGYYQPEVLRWIIGAILTIGMLSERALASGSEEEMPPPPPTRTVRPIRRRDPPRMV